MGKKQRISAQDYLINKNNRELSLEEGNALRLGLRDLVFLMLIGTPHNTTYGKTMQDIIGNAKHWPHTMLSRFGHRILTFQMFRVAIFHTCEWMKCRTIVKTGFNTRKYWGTGMQSATYRF